MNNIKQNLEILLAAVEAQPETHFNLDSFKEETTCGTLFCTAGLAASMPYFQKLDLSLVYEQQWFGGSVWRVFYKGESIMDGAEVDEIFGKDAWSRLFGPAGGGDWDLELGFDWWKEGEDDNDNITHKELAIARLKKQVELYSYE